MLDPTGNFSLNNSRRKASSLLKFSRAIMDSISQEKPKKVLTEAQRLAFLKGREKRMANLEKKRLADLEIASASMSPPPSKPKLKRQTNKLEENSIPVQETKPQEQPPSEANDTKPSTPPPPPPPSALAPQKKTAEYDPDEIVERIMKRLPDMMGDTLMKKFMAAVEQDSNPPKKKRATSEPKERPKKPKTKTKTRPVTPPPVNNFTWM